MPGTWDGSTRSREKVLVLESLDGDPRLFVLAPVHHREGPLAEDLEDLRASQIHHKRATQGETKSRKELYAFDAGDDGDDEGGGERREKGRSRDWDQLSELSDENEVSTGRSGVKRSNGAGRLSDETKGSGDDQHQGSEEIGV